MKRLPLYILLWLSTMLAQTRADTVISNDFFEVKFIDENYWATFPAELIEVRRIVQSSIDHWEDLLVNYAPTFNKANPITVTLTLDNISAIGYAKSHYVSIYGLNPKVESNGLTYNTITGAMDKILRGNSGASHGETDIAITVQNREGYYYGEEATGFDPYDFHTIFLHELTHGMGFGSYHYQTDGTKVTTTGLFVTPFDTLIQENIEGTLELGDELDFGKTGYGVFNPAKGDPGSSFAHFEEDSDLLMKPYLDGGDAYRTLGAAELAVFEAMGYDLADIVPEPSSVVLVLLVTPACLLRRRRAKA